MEVGCEFSFDAAHRLSFHKGKCKNIHGHTYKLKVFIKGKKNEKGIIKDFKDIENIIKEKIIDELDHKLLLYKKDKFLKSVDKVLSYFSYININRAERNLVKKIFFGSLVILPFEPTAENLCEYIFLRLEQIFKKYNLEISEVILWESPRNQAIIRKL